MSADDITTSTRRLLFSEMAQQHHALRTARTATITTLLPTPLTTETPTVDTVDDDGSALSFNPNIPKSWFDADELEELDALVGADLNCFGNNESEIYFSDNEFAEKAHLACLNAGDRL